MLANPRFKGSLDESEISASFTIKTKKIEILFLELMYYMLSGGGRCAVIVPDDAAGKNQGKNNRT